MWHRFSIGMWRTFTVSFLPSKQLILTNLGGEELEVFESFFIPQRSEDKRQSFWTSERQLPVFRSLTVLFSLSVESTYSEIPGD